MTVQLKEVYQPDVERKMRNVYNSLSEKDRRRYAAAEAVKLGYGGVAYFASLFYTHSCRPGKWDDEHRRTRRCAC